MNTKNTYEEQKHVWTCSLKAGGRTVTPPREYPVRVSGSLAHKREHVKLLDCVEIVTERKLSVYESYLLSPIYLIQL